eukprot:s59_g84.t1
MFVGLRSEVSRVLAENFRNLQVLHEALDQPGGLVALAEEIAQRLGENNVEVAHELRMFRQNTERDMKRERRLLHKRLVCPRLESSSWDASQLQESYDHLLAKETVPVRKVHKSKLSQALTLEVGNLMEVAEEERVRWANELAEYMVEAELPVAKIVEKVGSQVKIWGRIFGSRRAKTLRNRAMVWKKFYIWLVLTRARCWPEGIHDVLDYMEGKVADGCGHTVPQGIMGALALLETVGRVDDGQKLSRDPTLLGAVRNMQVELQSSAPPRRQARPLLIALIIGLELVCSDHYKEYARVIAWVILLMCWMTLRADDVQWVDPTRMRMDSLCVRFTLLQTKTTGPGRRAVEVPAFVARDVGLSGKDWLGTGWDLYHSAGFLWERSYFLPAPNRDWSHGVKKFLSTENFNSYLRYVLTLTKRPIRSGGNLRGWEESGEPLLPGELTSFWSGHGPRHFLPTHAANVGIGKEQRDFLGRWEAGAQESNAYIVSARQAVKERQYDDSEYRPENDNYGSARDHKQQIETQFAEEEKMGFMFPLTEAAARRRYGDRLRVAALGAIPKDDGRVRVIFDATHFVQVNNHIGILDRLEFPGPEASATAMESTLDSGFRLMVAVAADIALAHRRSILERLKVQG